VREGKGVKAEHRKSEEGGADLVDTRKRERIREANGWKSMKKEVRDRQGWSSGWNLECDYSRREKNRGTYDSIEWGHICRVALCRILHSSASSDLLDATSKPLRRKERAQWRNRSTRGKREKVERERERENVREKLSPLLCGLVPELYRHIVLPAEQ